MSYKYFSSNGAILPIEEAAVSLRDVEYSYGFGVYETIRVSKGAVYFLDEHCGRLLGSAAIINLAHTFTRDSIATNIRQLLEKNRAETCNVKVLLIGSKTKETAKLYIMCLNPLFPDRKLYKNGVHTIIYEYERDFPQAKTLNMLSSYLAYKKAQESDAYEALLINKAGFITEGTRTNFFGLRERTIISPKESDILMGVTRTNVLEIARQKGFKFIVKDIKPTDLGDFESTFLTSTSAKIMPIRSIDKHELGPPSVVLVELMRSYDEFLSSYTK